MDPFTSQRARRREKEVCVDRNVRNVVPPSDEDFILNLLRSPDVSNTQLKKFKVKILEFSPKSVDVYCNFQPALALEVLKKIGRTVERLRLINVPLEGEHLSWVLYNTPHLQWLEVRQPCHPRRDVLVRARLEGEPIISTAHLKHLCLQRLPRRVIKRVLDTCATSLVQLDLLVHEDDYDQEGNLQDIFACIMLPALKKITLNRGFSLCEERECTALRKRLSDCTMLSPELEITCISCNASRRSLVNSFVRNKRPGAAWYDLQR